MSTFKFAETHNLVAFLKKPTESEGFEQVVDFLNTNPIKYALTVNPTIYTSCIQQFWDSAKVKTVNEDVQIRALVDGKKIIITETSIRRDLQLQDAEGTTCLPNAAIFEELARMGIFVNPSLTKKVFANMKRVETGFSGGITLLFETMMVQALEKVSEIPIDTQDTPILTQPSSSQPHMKHKSRRKQRKATEVPHTEPQTEEHIPTLSHDPLTSGDDRMKLSELMEICTKLSDMFLSLEQIKTNQEAEIEKLKKKVKKLEGKKKKRTHGLKRRIHPKQGKIAKIDDDEDLSLINETAQDQGRMNDEDLFGVNNLDGDEVIVDVTDGENVEQDATAAEKEVSVAADKVVTTAESVEGVIAVTTLQISKDDVTLAQTLIEIKAAKPRARGVTIQEPSKFRTTSPSQPSQPPQAKDKEVMEGSKKTQAEVTKCSFKRAGDEIEKESAKRQRLEKEDDTAKLKRCLEIVSEDDDDVTIEATPLSSKSPTIVDYKICKEGKKSYFKIIRADGNSQNYLTFRTMFKNFNREDLEVLRSIMKERFKNTKPNVVYYLLVEKMYPFTNNILHQLWKDVRLQVDYEMEMAYGLLRLSRRQINEGYMPA
nr:xylulose kinase-1 [Tanacetum cinerariifolium]